MTVLLIAGTLISSNAITTATPLYSANFNDGRAPAPLLERFPKMEVTDGALSVSHTKGHAASPTLMVPFTDGTFRFRFKLGDTKLLVCRFEEPTSLGGKNAHLGRLEILPDKISLKVDSPPNQRERREKADLDGQNVSLDDDEWHEVAITFDQSRLTASINDGEITLEGEHPHFAGKKTGVLFVIRNGSVLLDDFLLESKMNAEDHEAKARRNQILNLVAAKPDSPDEAKAIPAEEKAAVAKVEIDAEGTSYGEALFNDYVLPILARNCYECHSHEYEKAKGGLVVDSRHGLLTGGDFGPAIVPGDPDASLLMQAIRFHDEDFQMPPDGKLPEEDILRVAEWIERGAPDPRKSEVVISKEEKDDAAKNLWSIKPLQEPALPSVRDTSWPVHDLDRFVLARLEEENMVPAPEADPYTLLRRLHYVLTGLPPSPEEIADFTNKFDSPSPTTEEIIESKVDELLQTRAFGERWGRHWLDMVRYADVHGGTRPEPMPEAWRYRNWVIDAHRQGKPYDDFIREQIAGDLLPAETSEDRAEHQVATAFLALGHYDTNERDQDRVTLDRIDEQLDLVGRAFLGISIGCARCHDHKFDPLPTRDYYAMAGIFKSTATFNYRHMASPRMMVEPLPEVSDRAPHWMRAPRTRFQEPKKGTAINLKPGPPHSLVALEADKIVDEPIHIRGELTKLGEVVPRGFLTAVAMEDPPEIPRDQSGRLQLAEWLLHPEQPLTSRVLANRFWHHIFGQCIVRSVDNFGVMGDAPSHPELLDHLALQLREKHHWSLQDFLREVLTSRTWRMSTKHKSQYAETDPENRLLWRMNRRRFDAETVADWISKLGGRLNTAPATFTVPTFRVSNNSSTTNVAIPGQTLARRAVYWPVFRKDVPNDIDMLKIYDFPDPMTPTGGRNSTTLPTQALFLLDSPMALNSARGLANKLTEMEADEERRLELAYLTVLHRPATPNELTNARQFLDHFSRSLDEAGAAKQPRDIAWNRFCHSLLISNESLTVD